MWIVKLGGSWVSNPELLKLIDKLYNYRNEPIVLVVGGGKFVDAIRFAHEQINFDEGLAHKLSVKSTEIYARILKNIAPKKISFVKCFSEINSKKKLEIFLPYKELIKDKLLKKNWESTSDSIACWLARKIKGKGVIFIKSVSFENQITSSLDYLQKKGILDKNINYHLNTNIRLKVVGPEILCKIDKIETWNKIINSFTKIEWKKKIK